EGRENTSHHGENSIASLEAGKKSGRTGHVQSRLTGGQRPWAIEGVGQETIQGEVLGQDLIGPSRAVV
ncbi:hypothetical protein ACQP3C_28870, partial [Escherichia coli]